MRTTTVLLVLLTAAASIFALPRLLPPASSSAITVHSQGPTVERLQRLSHLVTTRVLIADVLTGEGEGHVGAWLIKGDGLIGVDLSRATIIEKDDAARRATIQLAPPEVLQSRVDHERTRTWQVRKTAWMPWSGDGDKLRDEVMREAQRLVAKVAASEEYLNQSKTATEAIIAEFYAEIGWSVTVRWASMPCEGQKTAPSAR
jgi:hypothetical protein